MVAPGPDEAPGKVWSFGFFAGEVTAFDQHPTAIQLAPRFIAPGLDTGVIMEHSSLRFAEAMAANDAGIVSQRLAEAHKVVPVSHVSVRDRQPQSHGEQIKQRHPAGPMKGHKLTFLSVPGGQAYPAQCEEQRDGKSGAVKDRRKLWKSGLNSR